MTIDEYWRRKQLTDLRYLGFGAINPRTKKGKKKLVRVLKVGSVGEFHGFEMMVSSSAYPLPVHSE